MIETDTQRRVLVHLMVPRTVGDIERSLAREVGILNLDNGKPVSDIPVREVIQDLEELGAVKGFYGSDPHDLVERMQLDAHAITHEDNPPDPDGILTDEVATRHRGQVWADRVEEGKKNYVAFQPDATYYIMTQDAFDFLSTPGPDVPPEHEGLTPGPVVLGQMQAKVSK